MGFADSLKNFSFFSNKEVTSVGATAKIPSNNMPLLFNWFWTAKLGMPRKIDVLELRQYAKSCWVQMVTNAIVKQVMINEWQVIEKDEEDSGKYDKDIDKVKNLLENPNTNGDGFWDIWIPFLRDVLELDAGVVFKGKNGQGEIVMLLPYDGSRFLFDVDEHGLIDGYYQYSYRFPKNVPLYFEKNEIVYGQLNRHTEMYPYGFSPLQSIQQVVEIMIQSDRYNKEFFQNNAIPDGIVTAQMDAGELKRLQNQWSNGVEGKAHKLLFMNAQGLDFKPLGVMNKDMEWLEGQKWYFHSVFGAYGLSPQEVGFFENSNRSTSESQERVSVKTAVKPYMELISKKICKEIIPEVVGHDNIVFEWVLKDDVKERIEHEQDMAKLDRKVYTVNEVRAKEGLEPVSWGDEPFGMNSSDPFSDVNSEVVNGKDDSKEESDERVEGRKLYTKLFARYLGDGE